MHTVPLRSVLELINSWAFHGLCSWRGTCPHAVLLIDRGLGRSQGACSRPLMEQQELPGL